MGVRVADRKTSRAEYIERIRELNKVVGHAVANGPRKYMPTYGDRLVCTALDAYTEALAANSIYPSKGIRAERDYLARRGHLMEARAKVKAVGALADIYFSMMRERGLVDGKQYGKALSRMERIGLLCAECERLVNGVIKSDSDRFRRVQ